LSISLKLLHYNLLHMITLLSSSSLTCTYPLEPEQHSTPQRLHQQKYYRGREKLSFLLSQ
jgi:hypothetical protein